MFGGGRRRAAAAQAAREAERRALFTQLAQRPPHICPFLGLAYERTGYVEGPSIEHRCFAFGDPAPLSTEQQTRVCQERGYGQCPRYLRGLLVTPTEELQALRNPQAVTGALPPLPPSRRPEPVAIPPERRRRRILLTGLLILILLVILAGAGGAYLLLRETGLGIGSSETPEPTATVAPATAAPSATSSPRPTRTAAPTEAPSGSPLVSPTPEPTPSAGDSFAFYEVSVGPGSNLLFEIDDDGNLGDQRRATFDDFSFARVLPIEGTDGEVYWRTEDGGLAGLAYRYPDSNEFRIRAVFVDDDGSRRSVYLEEDDLSRFPEATPAP